MKTFFVTFSVELEVEADNSEEAKIQAETSFDWNKDNYTFESEVRESYPFEEEV